MLPQYDVGDKESRQHREHLPSRYSQPRTSGEPLTKHRIVLVNEDTGHLTDAEHYCVGTQTGWRRALGSIHTDGGRSSPYLTTLRRTSVSDQRDSTR